MNSEKFPVCNIYIELAFRIEPILNHPVAKKLFEKLQENQIIKKETSHQDWVKTFVENYQNPYKSALGANNVSETVNFRIKDNLLFINDKINFRDLIYHEIFIPYQLQKTAEEKQKHNWKKCPYAPLANPECIHNGIKLRVFIVNGIIKLQIGEFSLETSPNVIKNDVYQKYATITSFPLLYYPSIVYQIPENRLQASYYATDSFWKKENEGEYDKQFSDIWKIDKEISDFYLISEILKKWDRELGKTKDWELENEKRQTLIDQFSQKAKEWLVRECFEDLRRGDFHNKYLLVRLENSNYIKESFDDKMLSDYYDLGWYHRG